MKQVTYKTLLFTFFFLMNAVLYGQMEKSAFFQKLENAYDLLDSNPERAIEEGMEAFSIAKQEGNKWAMALGKAGIGYISYEVGDFKAAYLNYIDALETLERSDTTDLYNKTIILNELSLIQSDFNNHDESIDYSTQALKTAKDYIRKYPDHAEKNDMLRFVVDIPYYIAVEYQEKGAHQTAGKILVDLWEQAEDKDDIVTYSQVLNELGIIKMKNGEFRDAQEYFGLVVSGKGVFEEDKSIAYHNLAGTYMEQGNYEKANSYFLIALDMKKGLEDPYSQFITYQDLGELEYKQDNKEKAIAYWETGLGIYDKVDNEPELYSIYNWLQLAYMDIDVEKAKQFNLEYAKRNSFYVQNQTVQREEEARNRQDLIRYIDEQRQNRVDAEQRNRLIQQFWPVFLGVALLIIFSAIMGVRYYRALHANKELANAQLGARAVSTED